MAPSEQDSAPAGSLGGGAGDAPRLRPSLAFPLFAAAFVLLLLSELVWSGGLFALSARQVIALALPAIAAARLAGLPVLPALGISRPHPGALAGALLVGVSFWCVSLWLVVPIMKLIAGDTQALEDLARSIGWSEEPIWIRILAVAAVPAICEEILLRGAIARALWPHTGRARAVLVSTMLFALLHLPPARMVPAAALGAALGFAAVATDSAVTGIVIHFANNAIAIAALPALSGTAAGDLLSGHLHLFGSAAAALSGLGFWLIWRFRRAGGPTEQSRPHSQPR